ncbi:amino acid permease [Allonocardiopsis opalescens]|uniref:Amino acid/polyamine/organocation transporter (APC superfamily) n=1 Tax=Allonocardiopsis opalescens TaxID=1144618 RepID=A0A2T0PUS0_9ACTN|nr:amino acid permease [Allonocardiopsis opalescens]PRX92548.1 amino acid/polyamine/organocation transporter (APC superfamily) [Allonocardiopsis opalescens]
MSFWRTKSVEASIRETDEPGHRLRKKLTGLDLMVFGVGVIVGTGIFVITGQQAAMNAGPAIVVSFLIAGVTCALAALCYAEFASTVPVAGSAYTFGYATLGEFVAWVIGWDLVLELALGAAVVARGWSAYAQLLFDLPPSIAGDAAVVDVAAIAIVVALGVLAVLGTKLSGVFTGVVVAIKVGIVLFVVVAGLRYIDPANYSPYVPAPQPAEGGAEGGLLHTPLTQVLLGLEPSHFGLWGVVAAASVVFFSFIGFDIVATTAEETRRPQRDIPVGILGSLLVVTVLYMAVSAVVTGMRPYTELNTAAPLAEAFVGVGADWAVDLISAGGIIGITTVVLVLMMGQARIFFAMARDGLLPSWLARVHPRFGTPWAVTAVTVVIVAALAGFVPLAALSELVSIGTLFAFVVVSVGVVVLRRTRPDLPRAFRVPLVPLLPGLAVLACLWLMLNLPVETWLRFGIWMALGVVIYVLYGHRNSRLARREREERGGSGSGA